MANILEGTYQTPSQLAVGVFTTPFHEAFGITIKAPWYKREKIALQLDWVGDRDT